MCIAKIRYMFLNRKFALVSLCYAGYISNGHKHVFIGSKRVNGCIDCKFAYYNDAYHAVQAGQLQGDVDLDGC